MEKPEALLRRASGFSTLPNYETLIRTEHQLGETYAPRAKHGQAKLVYIRNDSGHMFSNLVILVSTGKQEGCRPGGPAWAGWPGNSEKITIIHQIFTFMGFPLLSPLYHGWKCPKHEPKPALFSFGVSACLIGKVKSCFIQKSIWHCAIHICDQESTDKCTIWGRTACATVQ